MNRKSVKHPRRERHGLDDILRDNTNLLRTLLLTAFLAAIAMRILIDPHMPYHYDVGKNMVYARAAADVFPLLPQWNPYFNLGEYYEYQVGFPYLVGALHAITGISVVDIGQVVIVLFGSALTLTMYILVLELTGRRDAALIAAFLTAASSMQVFTYINYYPQILATTFFPLSLTYIVRYYRTGAFTHLLASGFITTIVVLTSYIAGLALVILITVTVIIHGLRERSAQGWLPLPVTLASVALIGAAHWLPIVGRNGFDNVLNFLFTRFLYRGGGVSYDVDLSVETTFLLSTIVLALIAIIFVFMKTLRQRSNQSGKNWFRHWGFPEILMVCLVFLPLVLVSSIWIQPLVFPDRFLPFLDIGVIVVASIAIVLGIDRARLRWGRKALFLPVLIVLLFIVPFTTGWYFASVDIPLNIQSYPEVEEIVPPGALVAAPGLVQSFWLSAESGVHVLGGESSTLIGYQFLGGGDSDKIMDDTTVQGKMEIIRQYGVNYVYIPMNYYYPGRLVHSFTIESIEPFDNETYFDVVYFAEDPVDGYVFLIEVLEDLTPQYNQQITDNTLTITSYILSLGSIAFIFGTYGYKRLRGAASITVEYRIHLIAAIALLALFLVLCFLL